MFVQWKRRDELVPLKSQTVLVRCNPAFLVCHEHINAERSQQTSLSAVQPPGIQYLINSVTPMTICLASSAAVIHGNNEMEGLAKVCFLAWVWFFCLFVFIFTRAAELVG